MQINGQSFTLQLLTTLSSFTSVLLIRQKSWPGLFDPATGLLFCEILFQKRLSKVDQKEPISTSSETACLIVQRLSL